MDLTVILRRQSGTYQRRSAHFLHNVGRAVRFFVNELELFVNVRCSIFINELENSAASLEATFQMQYDAVFEYRLPKLCRCCFTTGSPASLLSPPSADRCACRLCSKARRRRGSSGPAAPARRSGVSTSPRCGRRRTTCWPWPTGARRSPSTPSTPETSRWQR